MPRDTALAYVSTTEAAALEDCTPRTMRWRVANKKTSSTIAREKNRGGKNGEIHLIPLSELSTEARLRYAMERDGCGADAEADLASYRERYGEEGLNSLMARLDAVRELKLLKAEDSPDLAQRRQELADALGVKVRRMYDLEKAYAEEGLGGMMERTARSDKGKSRALCPLAQDFIIRMYATSSKLSQNRVRNHLQEMKKSLGAGACEDCPHNLNSLYRCELMDDGYDPGDICSKVGQGMRVPAAKDAVNRFVAGLDKGMLVLARCGEKRFDDLFRPTVRREKPKLVNETWFGDHHVFDLFVLDSQGRAQKPWLTAWTDAASSKLVGWELSFNPNSRTIRESLVLGIAKTKNSDVCGAPNIIYIDNGMDYRSKSVEGEGERNYEAGEIQPDLGGENALLKTLGIKFVHATVENARAKIIERDFGIIETQWIRGLPGYCGNKIGEKPDEYMKDLKQKKLMTFEEFVGYFVEVVLPGYNNWKGADGKLESPNELYERLPKARNEVISWAVLSMAMTEKAERKIRPDGIYLHNRRYWDDAFSTLIGETVTVRYFSDNANMVSVFHDGQYVTTAPIAENFQLLNEEPEKVAEFIQMARGARKTRSEMLREAAKRVRMVEDRAMEIPDLSNPATLTSMVHERMYADRRALENKAEARQAARKAAGDPFMRRRIAEGSAALDAALEGKGWG
jgi:putative transposase